jgi:hypothetical protein
LLEAELLSGRLDYQDMVRLPHDEEQIVLRAMYETFLRHGLCLKEVTDAGPSLIFPSYFKRERPDLSDHPAPFVTYQFSGYLDEIYATLVVRLHYTSAFDHDQLWRFAADFKTQEGRRVGIKMIKQDEGIGQIIVYCDKGVPEDTKVTFIRYVNDHLKSKDPNVIRTRHYVCANCDNPINDHSAVQHRLAAGLRDIVCSRCEERVSLVDLIEQKFSSDEFRIRVDTMRQESKTALDAQSRLELLRGHAYAVAKEANQLFRSRSLAGETEGEIESRDSDGRLSGKRINLVFEPEGYSFSSGVNQEKGQITMRVEHLSKWMRQRTPTMLVVRPPSGSIEWMNLQPIFPKKRSGGNRRFSSDTLTFTFAGERFTALSLLKIRESLLGGNGADEPT